MYPVGVGKKLLHKFFSGQSQFPFLLGSELSVYSLESYIRFFLFRSLTVCLSGVLRLAQVVFLERHGVTSSFHATLSSSVES
jgi:hypothetical protein